MNKKPLRSKSMNRTERNTLWLGRFFWLMTIIAIVVGGVISTRLSTHLSDLRGVHRDLSATVGLLEVLDRTRFNQHRD